jgi:hypothetical protein
MSLVNSFKDNMILTSERIQKEEVRALPPIPESRGKEIIRKKQLNRSSITDRIENTLIPVNRTSIPENIKTTPMEGQLVLYHHIDLISTEEL